MIRNVPSFARSCEIQAEPHGGEELIELGPGETSLSFLQRVYRSPKQPMSRRLRAAIEAMPFEQPKLSAVAIGSMNDQDFAALLDRAIERSGKATVINGTCEEVAPPPPNETHESHLHKPVAPKATHESYLPRPEGGVAIKRRSIP